MSVDTVYADLHTHTTVSDGALSPSQLVRRAVGEGIEVLAVTDHDTVAGVEEAAREAQKSGIEYVPGVELSVTLDGQEIHLLAYDIDPDDEELREQMTALQKAREARVWDMVDRLRTHGLSIQSPTVEKETEGARAPGRPHIASVLVREGHVVSRKEAFDRYLGQGQPGFVAKPAFAAKDAIRMIHDAGGIAVLAHPGHWTSSTQIRTLRDHGLDGLELVHPSHDDSLQGYYTRLAQGYGLIMTGGSDFHGWREDDDSGLGRLGMTREMWERFREGVA